MIIYLTTITKVSRTKGCELGPTISRDRNNDKGDLNHFGHRKLTNQLANRHDNTSYVGLQSDFFKQKYSINMMLIACLYCRVALVRHLLSSVILGSSQPRFLLIKFLRVHNNASKVRDSISDIICSLYFFF